MANALDAKSGLRLRGSGGSGGSGGSLRRGWIRWLMPACALLIVMGVGCPSPASAQAPAGDGTAHAPPIADAADALGKLDRPEPMQRAAAVLWMAQHGTADDAVRVAPRLHDAEAEIRELAEQALWMMWSRSGDRDVDALLATGSEAMGRGELQRAIATFSAVVALKPDFAEGWNKRATARYMAGDYLNSMADCDEVLARNPLHFGALSGYGLILINLERYDQALDYLRKALAVNPRMDGVRANIATVERLLEARRRRTTMRPGAIVRCCSGRQAIVAALSGRPRTGIAYRITESGESGT